MSNPVPVARALFEAVRGSWRSFLEEIEPLRTDLYRYCRYLTRSPWDSEDLVQDTMARAELDRYARLFNARDWDGVRALVSDDCRLDVVSRSQRRGKQVGLYFARYEKENVALRVVSLEGRLAFAAYVAGADEPAYFILLEFEDGRVKSIRDFRYVPYIAAEAAFELLPP